MGAASRDTKKTATMADISLYLTNVNVSIGQTMNAAQVGTAFYFIFTTLPFCFTDCG